MSLYKNQPKNVRQKRVGEQIQRALASYLFSGKISLPGVDKFFINISHVQISADLRHAKVFLSIPSSCDASAILDIFQQNAAAFSQVLSKKISLKYLPTLNFHIDDFLQKSDKTETLFNDPKVKKDLHETTKE